MSFQYSRKQQQTASLACLLGGLTLAFPVCGQSYEDLLLKPILPANERRYMMSSFVDRNLPRIESPATREAWESRRKQLRLEILRIVGLADVDKRAPVRWISKGIIERKAYTIEKILFESYPGVWVPALVYTPRALTRPVPAMVSISGHEPCDSKAGLTVQARSVNLVQRGLIVLAYDYMGMFERSTGEDPCALQPYGGGNDHGLKAFSFTSRTPTALEILDAVRAIDYLCARKDVEKARIGFTGESGGGNTTYWIAALDERVRLAVPVSSVTTFDYWILNDRNWDWHQRPYGIRRVADIWTLLAMHAPRPMLVIASRRGTDDQEFPFEEADRTVRQAKETYRLYGAGANLAIWESKTHHGYQQDKREQMYAWVERHLLGQQLQSSPEMPFQFEPPNQLRCGLPPGTKTNAEIYSEWIAQAVGTRFTPSDKIEGEQIKRKLRERLRDLLGLPVESPQATLRNHSTLSVSDMLVRRSVLTVEPGIDLPVVDFSPGGNVTAPIVVVLGRSAETSGIIQPFTDRGIRVVFLDLRGTGEIDSGGQRTNNWAWFIGRSWPSMWLEDIRALITALDSQPVGLIGIGRFGHTALLTAAIDERIAISLALLRHVSYVAKASEGVLADVPRVLSVLDLPEMVNLISARACWLQFPRSVTEEQIRSAYVQPLGSQSRKGADQSVLRLTRSDQSNWNEAAEWFQARLKTSRARH